MVVLWSPKPAIEVRVLTLPQDIKSFLSRKLFMLSTSYSIVMLGVFSYDENMVLDALRNLKKFSFFFL